MPDCIHDFRKAGINVWMLTGDKFETAENIGFSCKMFNHDSKIFRMKHIENEEEIRANLTSFQ